MTDTSLPLKPKPGITTPMVGCKLVSGTTSATSGMVYIPLKETNLSNRECPQKTTFRKWFNTDVLVSAGGRRLSRKNLIFYFRHEKSAHSARSFSSRDGVPADALADLSRGDAGLGWRWIDRDGSKSVPAFGQEYATVRQIGWEVENTLASVCADIVSKYASLETSVPKTPSSN